MITVISFIVVLGFLVFVHELGHYLAARQVGVKVLTFSIGFPPKMFGKKIGDTDYIISWIPLGGYVQLYGQNLNDEDPSDPQNYAAKTIRQRLYILLGGPVMNLLVAFLLMPLVYLVGVNVPQYLDSKPVISSVAPKSFGEQIGIQKNDLILSINGQGVDTWESMNEVLSKVKEPTIQIEVSRNTSILSLSGTRKQLESSGELGLALQVPTIIGKFIEKSSAEKAGLRSGDRILKIADTSVVEWSDITHVLDSLPVTPGNQMSIPVEIERSGQIQIMTVVTTITKGSKPRLGIMIPMVNRKYGLVDAVKMGSERLVTLTKVVGEFFLKMVKGKGSMDEMGGPLRIAQAVGQAAQSSFAELLFLMAAISLQLGIFNLLPLPVLDGGHIFLLGIERIQGKVLSPLFRQRIQSVGVFLLLGLTIAITYNDILQVFFK